MTFTWTGSAARVLLLAVLALRVDAGHGQTPAPGCPPSPASVCEAWGGPDREAVEARIASLYAQERFAELETAMQGTERGQRRFIDGSSYADAVYLAFRNMMPGPGTRPSHESKIARWEAAVPGSVFVHFAKARYAYGMAWTHRGGKYANGVAQDSWKLFHDGLGDAEKILMDSPPALKSTPIWYRLLLATSLDMQDPKRPPADIFEEATKRWPLEFGFYQVMLSRLTPKWGGNWDDAIAFMRITSDLVSEDEGKSLYARLYIGLLRTETVTNIPLHWETLKPSFQDLVRRYPAVRFKTLYASAACLARDRPAFAGAVDGLSPIEIQGGDWIWRHSYAECLNWAGTKPESPSPR
jgi:hypothetical protein